MAAPTNAFTISRAAEILGEDEELLWEVATEMEPEDGLLWIHDTADQQHSPWGLENLRELIAEHTSPCSWRLLGTFSFVIRRYIEADHPAVSKALVDLQEHERAMHDTRLSGSGPTAIYFDKLREELAVRSGGIFVAEAAGKFAGVVTGLIES
jgi:hypothetical protein